LLNAVETLDIFHAYCFRHVLENFYKKFKNAGLKEKAWGLGKAKTSDDFDAVKNHFIQTNRAAYVWLENIGFEHLTLLDSPVCRYGIITSNNVESINSSLRDARKMPIMELLLFLEEKVATDRFKAYKSSNKWSGNLTKYAESILNRHINSFSRLSKYQLSETIFRVTSLGPPQKVFVVDMGNKSCSCGCMVLYKFPCEHFLLISRHLDTDVNEHICDTWKKLTYVNANKQNGNMGLVTTLSQLEKSDILPPEMIIRPGRRRMRRFDSQAVDRTTRRRIRRNRCQVCGQIGHERRNYPQRQTQ
jgi:hypothetical protein